MAESAIEKIMRLKREREASAVGGADSTPKAQVPETSEAQNVGQSSGNNLSNADSNCSVDISRDTVVVETPIQAPLSVPLSAMERLRQLKSGTSVEETKNEPIQAGSSGVSGSVSSGAGASVKSSPPVVTSEVLQKEEVQKVLKEAKTHPIAMEMAELEAALDAEVPGFVNILSAIHKKLRLDPECVTLLDDEEIGVIVAGLEKHTNVTIVSPNAVKAAKKAAKVSVSASDL